MDASEPNSGADAPAQPPLPAGEQPQEAEILGDGEAVEDEVLISKAQKLMNMITSSQENPNPKVLHALASILENQEARFVSPALIFFSWLFKLNGFLALRSVVELRFLLMVAILTCLRFY